MSVETRPVPCNLMAWPRVRDLISQQKAIYAYLYFCPDATACGCYLLSVDRAAVDLSMTSPSLDDALNEFVRRKLICRDKETAEVFVIDWPRWHNYITPASRGALWASIHKIQSQNLRVAVENAYKSIASPGKEKEKDKEKSKDKVKASSYEEASGGDRSLPPSPSLAGPTPPIYAPTRSAVGIKCWTQEDQQEAKALEEKYGRERIQEAIKKLDQEGTEALPSRVSRALQPPTLKLPHEWWTSEQGTLAAASQIQLSAYRGETMDAFRQRIRNTLQGTRNE